MADFHPSFYQMHGVGAVPYQKGVLLQFKAGKMLLENKKLKSDPRRGAVKVVKDGDGLVHLQWIERSAAMTLNDIVEDDVVVFPGEATFKKIGSTTQRVYVLQFPDDSSRDMFFWIQESSTITDEELCRQLNSVLNNPDDMMEIESEGISAKKSATNPETTGDQGAGPSAAQLAQFLSSIASSQGGSQPQTQATIAASLLSSACGVPMRPDRQSVGPSLDDILKPDILSGFLSDPDMLNRLAPHLPEQHRTQQSLLDLANSPQFQQQIKTFSMALQTGQLNLSTLGIKAEGFSVVDFLKGVQELVDKEQQEKSSSKES